MTDTRTAARRVMDALIPEKDFRQSIVDLARDEGWLVYFTWLSKHSPRGWPDLVLIRPPRLVFAELKTESGQPTAEQQECLEALVGCGEDVRLWRPADWDEIEGLLKGEGIP